MIDGLKLTMTMTGSELRTLLQERIEPSDGSASKPGNLKNSLTNYARLFMAPGMYHCTGGVGPNAFDALTALEQWVEQGQAPASIVATQASGPGAPRTRPLCPFLSTPSTPARGAPPTRRTSSAGVRRSAVANPLAGREGFVPGGRRAQRASCLWRSINTMSELSRRRSKTIRLPSGVTSNVRIVSRCFSLVS